jgi:hypothetical protein
MQRDDDPPEREPRYKPESARAARWPEQIARDDLRRFLSQGGADTLDVVATETWIDRFSKQYNRKLMESVSRYAASRLSWYASVPPGVENAHALAEDALMDTMTGRLRWDPEGEKTLGDHLADVVSRRLSAAWERTERLPHVSLNELDDEQAPALHEVERVVRERGRDPRAVEHARDRIAELERRAADDPDALALIRAMLEDKVARADVMAITGFSPQRYRAATRRLRRLAEDMRNEEAIPRNGKAKE